MPTPYYILHSVSCAARAQTCDADLVTWLLILEDKILVFS